jgi:hypothetical protein
MDGRRCAFSEAFVSLSWLREFDEPIVLPNGRTIITAGIAASI